MSTLIHPRPTCFRAPSPERKQGGGNAGGGRSCARTGTRPCRARRAVCSTWRSRALGICQRLARKSAPRTSSAPTLISSEPSAAMDGMDRRAYSPSPGVSLNRTMALNGRVMEAASRHHAAAACTGRCQVQRGTRLRRPGESSLGGHRNRHAVVRGLRSGATGGRESRFGCTARMAGRQRADRCADQPEGMPGGGGGGPAQAAGRCTGGATPVPECARIALPDQPPAVVARTTLCVAGSPLTPTRISYSVCGASPSILYSVPCTACTAWSPPSAAGAGAATTS